MMKAEGIDREVLESYVEMRKAVTKHVDRIVAITSLLMLLKHCGDDLIKVSPMALSELADQIDSDACAIQDLLDDFIFQGDAEAILEQGS
jgi:hypothetical protein